MQINNNRPVDFYPAVNSDSRNAARLPVVVDNKTDFKPIVSEQRADNTSVILSAERVSDAQQARFVRNFSTRESGASQITNAQQVLPRPVQQYLDVAALNGAQGVKQGLLDEIV